MADISELELQDRVYHRAWGVGTVIRCTEKPSVTVKFGGGGRKVFTKSNQRQLAVFIDQCEDEGCPHFREPHVHTDFKFDEE